MRVFWEGELADNLNLHTEHIHILLLILTRQVLPLYNQRVRLQKRQRERRLETTLTMFDDLDMLYCLGFH